MNNNRANRFRIRPEELVTVVNSFFEKLTELQWVLVKKGVWDSDLQALFADMITEIIQSVSAQILKTVLPAVQRQMEEEEFKADKSTALGKVHLSLGHSLSTSITSALNIPHETCDSAEELTRMIEEEIFNKVSSAVSLLVEKPELRPEPAVYVSVKVTDIKKLRCMVSQAASYLKRCAGKMSSLLSVEEIEMPLTARHKLIIDEALKATKNNLHYLHVEDEQCTEAEENAQSHQRYNAPEDIVADVISIIIDHLNNSLHVEATAEPEQSTKDEAVQYPCTLTEMIASEAVVAIIDKLDAEKCVEAEEMDDFNVGLLTEKVRDFLASWTPLTKHNAGQVYKDHFFKFAEKEFEKLIRELKQQVKKNQRFFICLQEPHRSSLDQRSDSEESVDSDLPAAVQEILHPETCRSSRSSLSSPVMEMVVKGWCSSLDFNTIKPDLNQLFDKLIRKKDLGNKNKNMDNIHTMEMKIFSRQLSDKMYDHLQRRHTYPIPMMPQEGRSLLNSVISRTPHPTGKFPFSPEVSYASVEDSVEKFLQKILLWLENKAVDQTVQSDNISAAVDKIQNVTLRAMKRTEEKERDKLSPSFPQSSVISAPKNEPTSRVTAVQQDLSEERSETASMGHTRPTGGQSQPADAKRIVKHFIFLVFLRAFEKAKRRTNEFQYHKHIIDTVYYVRDLLMDELTSAESLIILEENMDDINKAMMTRLLKKYGSPTKLLQAAFKDYYSFGNSLIKHLNIVLEVYLPPKEFRCSSCCSAEGKAFRKPFFWCCCINTEDQTLEATELTQSITHTRSTGAQSQKTENLENPFPHYSVSPEKIVEDFIFLLFLRAFELNTKYIVRAQDGEKILATMDSLTDLLMHRLTSTESLRVFDSNFFKLIKTMGERLYKEFGCPGKLLSVALAEDSPFGDTLVNHLDIVLDSYSRPKK